jgi:type VI secretion system secreted protein VgrG
MRILSLIDTISSPFISTSILYEAEALDILTLPAKSHTCDITLPGGKTRTLNGLVSKARQGKSTVRSTAYTLELRPWFYFLQYGSGCRLFQNKTAPEILTEIAEEAGYTDIKDSLTASYPKLAYVIQYNESDFDFLSRLLEEAGIFYYFIHEKGRHIMVLADSPQGCRSGPELQWIGENFPQTPDACIWNVEMEASVQPTAVQTDDNNYTNFTAKLSAKSGKGYPMEAEYAEGQKTQAEGEAIANRRLEGYENAAQVRSAKSSHTGLSAGMIFTIKGHPDSGCNKKWLITALEMHTDTAGGARLTLQAIPGDKTYRPRRIHRQKGASFKGMVCGKSGEEIWTDEYGRIKVRFLWDHKTKDDENASIWLRTAQMYAGKGHGIQSLPRVGDEVLVEFFDGEPIVTGSIYNSAARPPYSLPDNKTVEGIKTQSNNEITMDDKKDAERLYLHAQKLLEIIAEKERKEDIMGDDTLKVKGNRTIQVEGNYSITVKGDLSIKAQNIKLESEQACNVKAGTALELSGATFKLAGSAKGEVNGGGILDVKGGLVKLN